MNDVRIVVDGREVPLERATVSVLDRGLLYGDGLFEVLRTWGGRAVDLPAHLDRLADSARFLALPIDRTVLADSVALALGGAGEGEHRIRIVVTRGPGALAVPMASAGPGRTIVIVESLGPLPETTTLAIVDWPLPRRAGRGHKTLAYLDHVIARELAREAGADDAVRLDADGQIAEGGTCNVFCVRGGEIHAASGGGVLPGITAARVVAIARRIGLPVRVGPIAVEAFLAADEAFVTSAVRGVVPVTRILAAGEWHTPPSSVIARRIRAAHVGEMAVV